MADPFSLQQVASGLGVPLWALILLFAWSALWKLAALWKSARLNQPVWFIFLAIINTFGIFEILYIFLFSEIKLSKVKRSSSKRNRKQ